MSRNVIVFFAVVACSVLHAQTAAQKALSNEPEIRQIQRNSDDLHEKQALPFNDVNKPTNAQTIMQGFTGLKSQQILLDGLEARLQMQAVDCHFCASKQDELSELLRQELAIRHTYQNLYRTLDASAAAQQLFGVTPVPDRWKNRDLAVQEARKAVDEYCANASSATGASGNLTKAVDCIHKTTDAAFLLASVHEKTWASCFKKHDWVQNSSERIPYETCMKQDPWVMSCSAERASRPTRFCSDAVITAADVDYLRHYQDRWITDPKRISVMAHTVMQDPIHVTLLEPVTTPVIPPPSPGNLPNAQVKVRARLETPIEFVTREIPGRAAIIPAGTEIPIDVHLYANGPRPTGAKISMMLTSFSYNDPTGRLVDQYIILTNPLQRSFSGWPPATGSVLLAVNSPLTFETRCECVISTSQAIFSDLVQNHPNKNLARPGDLTGPVSSISTHPILQGSRIQTILLEPIDVTGIKADKRFHAQLNVDMELPRNSSRPDALKLPRGTDVYLKVTDNNSGSPFGGHTAELAVDYVLVNGQQISLNTPPWPHTFTEQVPRPSNRRRPVEESILWPVGDTKWFDITDQVEVSEQTIAAGTSLQEVQSKAVALNASDKTAQRIYPGSQLPLVLIDPIDLASMSGGKLYHAKLSADMRVLPNGHRPDTLVLVAGTDVYLRAVQKNSGSSTQIPVEISTDHIVYNGREVPLETSPLIRMITTSQSSAQPQGTTSRRLSVPRFGNISIPTKIPQIPGSSSAASNSVVQAAQTEIILTTSKESVVSGDLAAPKVRQ